MSKRKTKDNRIRFSIRAKVITLLVILTVTLMITVTLLGADSFREAMYRRYDEMAYQIAHSVDSFLDDQEVTYFVDSIKKYMAGELTDKEKEELLFSGYYKINKRVIEDMRANMDANDIYFVVVDMDEMHAYTPELKESGNWKPLHYIMDCYYDNDNELQFGDTSSVVVKYREVIENAMETGKEPDEYIITDTQFGYNMSALLPVVVDGKAVAMIGVEIPMKTIRSDIASYAIQIGVAGVIILIIALVIAALLSVRMFIRPIKLVAEEANHFISTEATVSDKLGSIKTRDEIQMLSESLLTMELSIHDYIEHIQQITAEKERIGAELNVATHIQASMLPTDFSEYDDRSEFDIYATMNPAKEVGGDFYDFFMTDDTHLVLVMADVSGKGVPAALFMAKAKTAIKTRAMTGGSPSDILADVNEMMCEGNEGELFVTVWMTIIDLEDGSCVVVNAGHEHPAVRKQGGSYELIKYRHSPAVGTMEGMIFKQHDYRLEPGEMLFVYTDGVTEATDAKDELFGEERLTAVLNRNKTADPTELLPLVKEAIDEFVGDAPQFDDITMMAVRYNGKNT